MGQVGDALAFLGLSALWGTAFVAISAGLADLPPVLFAAIRYDIAGVLLILYIVATEDPLPRTRADWITIGVGAILLIAAYNALLFTGQRTVTSGVAAILIATNPILAAGFSRLLLRTRPLAPTGVLGLLLGFGGVVLVVRPPLASQAGVDPRGGLLVLGAAIAVALGSVTIQRLDHGLSPQATVAWSCALGAILLHMVGALLSEGPADATFSLEAVLAIAYLAIFASAIGYFVYFAMLDRLGAVQINLVSYAAPVFAAIAGWILLGETLTATTVAGFVAIAIGFMAIKREAIARAMAA